MQGWVHIFEEDANTCEMSDIPVAGTLSLWEAKTVALKSNKAIYYSRCVQLWSSLSLLPK
jgi:hypothetical protein